MLSVDLTEEEPRQTNICLGQSTAAAPTDGQRQTRGPNRRQEMTLESQLHISDRRALSRRTPTLTHAHAQQQFVVCKAELT